MIIITIGCLAGTFSSIKVKEHLFSLDVMLDARVP
jgi:hypothetical protein